MIYFLETSCSSPELAVTLTIVKRIMIVIQILGPLLLIISLVMTFIKLMSNPDDKKLTPKIKNSILGIFLLFFVPLLVNVVMGMLDGGVDIATCWNSSDYSGGGNSSYVDVDGEGKKKPISSSKYEGGNGESSGTVSGSSSTGTGSGS